MRRKTGRELEMEREANQFAMELLMPEDLVRREVKKIGNVNIVGNIEKLANLFEVDGSAMAVRLMHLGYFEPYSSGGNV